MNLIELLLSSGVMWYIDIIQNDLNRKFTKKGTDSRLRDGYTGSCCLYNFMKRNNDVVLVPTVYG